MEKNSLKWYSVLGMGLLYMVMVFAACFFGVGTYTSLLVYTPDEPKHWLAVTADK